MPLGTRTSSGSEGPAGSVDVDVEDVEDVGIEEVVITEPPEAQQIHPAKDWMPSDATLLNSACQVASLISQTPWKEKATPFVHSIFPEDPAINRPSTTPSKGYKHWMVVPTAAQKRINQLQEGG